MRVSIVDLGGVPVSDSDVEHIQRFEQMHHSFPGVPDDEAERLQAAALGLSVEQFRRLGASLAALKR